MAFLTQRTEPETEKGLVSSSQIVDGEGVVVEGEGVVVVVVGVGVVVVVVTVRTKPVSIA